MNPSSGGCDDPNDLRGASPSIDETLEILGHPLRRAVIHCCAEAPENVLEIEAIADQVASASEVSGEAVDRDRLLAECHHQHLPMMAERGLIDFDPRSGQLRYRPSALVERWLRRIREEQSE